MKKKKKKNRQKRLERATFIFVSFFFFFNDFYVIHTRRSTDRATTFPVGIYLFLSSYRSCVLRSPKTCQSDIFKWSLLQSPGICCICHRIRIYIYIFNTVPGGGSGNEYKNFRPSILLILYARVQYNVITFAAARGNGRAGTAAGGNFRFFFFFFFIYITAGLAVR